MMANSSGAPGPSSTGGFGQPSGGGGMPPKKPGGFSPGKEHLKEEKRKKTAEEKAAHAAFVRNRRAILGAESRKEEYRRRTANMSSEEKFLRNQRNKETREAVKLLSSVEANIKVLERYLNNNPEMSQKERDGTQQAIFEFIQMLDSMYNDEKMRIPKRKREERDKYNPYKKKK